MGIDQSKLIRTSRLSLTCLFLFILTWYFQLPESAWALITIWFVMYEYTTVGGVMNKSMLRFVGTTLSALYGIIVIYCCGNDPIINMLALVAGLFLYAYWFMGNEKTYSGTIGAVTLTIVLLNYNDVEVALLRAFNVLIGILMSVFMMRFFYPVFARDILVQTQINSLSNLTNLITDYLDVTIPINQIKAKSDSIEHVLFTNVTTYDRLLGEAKWETREAPFFIIHSKNIKELLQRVARLLSMYIDLLSTEAARSQPWIQQQMTMTAEDLSEMKFQLLGLDKKPKRPKIAMGEHVLKVLESPVRESIETVFNEMNSIVGLLEQEVAQVSRVHDYYYCLIEDSIKAQP